MKLIQRYDYLIVGLVSFLYYLLLSAKSWSWIFASQDSGDWLASSVWWMNSQPYGSPLYILLGHLMNWIFPHHLVLAMAIGLSVIPASITVAVLYLIVKQITKQRIYGLIAGLVLLGSAVALSQATIIEEYAISSMFVTLAFYFYLNDKKKLTILMLGLGSAVHVVVICITALWMIVSFTEYKAWLKTLWIYVLVGILPYSFVLFLMYFDTPRLLAGHLSFAGINNYLGSTGTIASLSINEVPLRLLQFAQVFCVSLGLAIVPLIMSFKGILKRNQSIIICLVTMCFVVWLYITDTDPTCWTFMNFGFPLIVVLAMVGLQKMSNNHNYVIIGSALFLIILNSFFLNANTLTNQYPLATEYEQSVKNIPDGSYLICNSGGQYGLANYYVMAQGKKITPLFYSATTPDLETMVVMTKEQNDIKDEEAQKIALEKYNASVQSPRYLDYIKWAKLDGKDTIEQTKNLLAQGEQIYIVEKTITPYWDGVFQTETVDKYISKVVGVN